MNSWRLRHSESSVYAIDTRSGSRVFQASSAAFTLARAVSSLNGGRMSVGLGTRRRLALGPSVVERACVELERDWHGGQASGRGLSFRRWGRLGAWPVSYT